MDIKKQAKSYEEKLENYKNLNVSIADLNKFHSLSEQNFDSCISKLEESLQEDIQKINSLNVFNSIIQSFKKVFE